MKNEEILIIERLSVAFQTSNGKTEAVKDVSLSLRRGEVLALVGESGSGKTVLCRSILKLLPGNTILQGERIQYREKNLLTFSEKQMQQIRGQGIAMVFQDPLSTLNPTMTVGSQIREAVLLHAKSQSISGKQAKRRAIELMTLVGIKNAEERYEQYPYHFSGGMRQRCVLAVALASDPEILIADEPTTALDVTIQAEILELLKKLKEQLHLSILFVTHDLGVVAKIADRVAVMQKGKIVESKEKNNLFCQPEHPYTKQLLQDHPYYILQKEKMKLREAELDQPAKKREKKKENLVEISHLSYAYPVDRKTMFPAVRDVSFEIRRDEIFGLVGESGSGKSTIGKCLMGILTPQAEVFSYDGISLLEKKERKKNARRLQKERQMIFQDSASSLNQRMKVEQILAEPLEIHNVFRDKKEQHRFLCEMMEEVELQEADLRARPSELSGGQRQRVAIARAFAMKPKLLVADEPIASLDVTTQAQMVKLFRHLQKEHDCAILFIAHDLSMVRLLCDRIGVMKDGSLVETGETEQVFRYPKHSYTKKLLAAIPVPEADKSYVQREEIEDEETMG